MAEQNPRTNCRPFLAKRRGAANDHMCHTGRMQAALLRELHGRRFSMRARWEALLRTEPVVTPLGLPDTLVHLIETTLEEVFSALGSPPGRRHDRHAGDSEPPFCPCGRNPLLAYFTAAGQALREGLILSQAACAPLDPLERDASLHELDTVLRRIATREIEAFCGVCQFRHLSLPAPVQPLAICGGGLSRNAPEHAVELRE
jgi:hypothetical protein